MNDRKRKRESGEEFDVVIICDHQRFPCNKASLSKHSPYFEAMFESGMLESSSKEIILQGTTPGAVKILSDYAFSNSFEATDENALTALTASNMFQFNEIKTACIEYLLGTLDAFNCIRIMASADFLYIPKLLRPALQIALWQFSIIVTGNEFSQMQLSALEIYLSHNGLNVKSELEVFDAINVWIDYDSATRSQYMMRLIKAIRFRSLTEVELNTMLQNERVKSEASCVDLLTSLKMMDEEAQCLLDVPGRLNPLVPAVICRRKSDNLRYLTFVNTETKEMVNLSKLHIRYRDSCIVGGHHVYVISGNEVDSISVMWRLNTFTNRWTFVSNLPLQYSYLCVLYDCIYLIGGPSSYAERDRFECSLNRYNTSAKTWDTLESPPIATHSHMVSCTALDDKIYLVREFSDDVKARCVHYGSEKKYSEILRYTPLMNTWTVLRGKLPADLHCALPHHDGIYFVDFTNKDLILYFGNDEKPYSVIGKFKHFIGNACIVGNIIYAFWRAGVEVYNIKEKEFSSVVDVDASEWHLLPHSFKCFALPLYNL